MLLFVSRAERGTEMRHQTMCIKSRRLWKFWPSPPHRNPQSSSIKLLKQIVYVCLGSQKRQKLPISSLHVTICSHMTTEKVINTNNCNKLLHRTPSTSWKIFFPLRYSRFKRSRCHELSDQNNTFLSFARSLPGVIETDNVRMLETLQHPGLFFEALTLRLGQLAILHTGQERKMSHPYRKIKETFIGNLAGRSI